MKRSRNWTGHSEFRYETIGVCPSPLPLFNGLDVLNNTRILDRKVRFDLSDRVWVILNESLTKKSSQKVKTQFQVWNLDEKMFKFVDKSYSSPKTISREWLTKKPFSIAKFESMITWMSFAWTSLFAKVWSLVVNISMTGLMWESKSSWLKFNLNSKKSLSPPNASIRNINSIPQRFEEFQN